MHRSGKLEWMKERSRNMFEESSVDNMMKYKLEKGSDDLDEDPG